MATAQINVRLDRELKEAGDRGLARRGLTPSQAVRSLWRVFAEEGERSDAAAAALLGWGAEDARSEQELRRIEALDRIDRSWERLASELGLDLKSFVPMTDDEMREARYEYLVEKYGE